MERKGLYIVMASISPEKEEAFNKWYNEEHLPMNLEIMPGILSGRRYKIISGSPHEEKYRYMAMYEYKNYEMLEAAQGPERERSELRKRLHREYNEMFGEGGRYQIRAIELKNLIVG